MSDDLPVGWVRATTAEVCERVVVGFVGPSRQHYLGDGVPFLTGKNIRFGRLLLENFDRVSRIFHERERKSQLHPNDVVVVRIGRSGEAAVVPPTLRESNCGGLVIAKAPRAVAPSYLAWYLNSPQGQAQAMEEVRGVTRQTLNTKSIARAEIPIAPLAEQHRIVEKVETLFEQVNRAKGRLDRVPLILKRFRQAVLAAACSGELTKEWRAAQSVDQPWASARVAELCPVIQYGYTASARVGDKGPRFLRITDIRNGRVDWSTVPTCDIRPDEVRKFALREGDIVFARSGATTGKSFLIGRCPEAVFASYLIRVRPGGRVSSPFLYLCFQTLEYWSYITDNMAGNAQPNCNASKLAELEVPLPSIEEQGEIVRQVELLFALADSIERRVQVAMARAEKLPQAILSKAFSGELVPTEAELARAEGRTYETAGELLARVTGEAGSASRLTKAAGTRRRG